MAAMRWSAADLRGTVAALDEWWSLLTAGPQAEVGAGGVAGDRQAKRRYHGRVWQALSLWSAEVVERLQVDGHSIAPGAAGDAAVLQPGRVAIGDRVVVEP
jgi:MOSC domain-containing protein YiiM